MAADVSPRFRAVADDLMHAKVTHGIPGAALGILMDGQEEHAVFGTAINILTLPRVGDG